MTPRFSGSLITEGACTLASPVSQTTINTVLKTVLLRQRSFPIFLPSPMFRLRMLLPWREVFLLPLMFDTYLPSLVEVWSTFESSFSPLSIHWSLSYLLSFCSFLPSSHSIPPQKSNIILFKLIINRLYYYNIYKFK